MNKAYKILILILIAVILVMYFTTPKPVDLTEYIKIDGKEYILLSTKIDTVWIINETEVPVYVPQLVSGETVEVLVPVDVDTTAILKKYFAKNIYRDTILLDSVGSVSIKDTISQNMIFSREVIYSYKIPTFTETIIVKDKPKTSFYLGVGGIASPDMNNIYGSALMRSKKDKLYSFKLGMGNTESKTFITYGVEMHWKLGKNNN